MIVNFRHKGLARLFNRGDPRGLRADTAAKVARMLLTRDTAKDVSELGLFPGWRLHRLSGNLHGYWSLSVTRNWRIIFRFEDGGAYGVDLVDYH